jgi:hypothetical protein
MYGGAMLFAYSLVSPALQGGLTDATEQTRLIWTADSHEPFELPHVDPAVETPENLPSTAAISVSGNTVDQTHSIDAYVQRHPWTTA